MPDKLIESSIIAKILGGIAGNLVAQSILKPENARDFIQRLLSSLILAYFTTYPVLNYFDLEKDTETAMAVALGIGTFGYFVVSVILKTINNAKTIHELKENIK